MYVFLTMLRIYLKTFPAVLHAYLCPSVLCVTCYTHSAHSGPLLKFDRES